MKFLSKLMTTKLKTSPIPFLRGNSLFAVIIITTFMYAFTPKTANASIFSLISELGGSKVSAKVLDASSTLNSQKMPLLEAATNSNPNPHRGEEVVITAHNNALSAEIGPQGTVFDIKEDQASNEISLYTVRDGDTLSSIADIFGVSINTIVWANELGKNKVVKEGQILVILPISGIKYTVKKGDTIRGITFRYKANLEDILEYNDLTLSSVLNPGDTIVIPDAEPTYVETPRINSTYPSLAAKESKALPFYPGYYIRPIVGGVKSQGVHGHNGIDLAAPVGTVIRASASGKVISSISNEGWNGGYGNYIIVSHDNGTQTLYSHTQKNFVTKGDYVEQGQMIAKIGMTGKTTGPHVHFEIRGAKNPF